MPKDLRTYLEQLRRNNPHAILRIDKPLKVAYEITALQRKLDALKNTRSFSSSVPFWITARKAPSPW